MQDEETGSWWQQITGEAIFGSSKGQRLNPVLHDELSFSVWKREHPDGRVLLPDDSKPWKRFSETGKTILQKCRSCGIESDTRLSGRTQIVGIKIGPLRRLIPVSHQRADPVLITSGDAGAHNGR
jgi:hypothetical protein